MSIPRVKKASLLQIEQGELTHFTRKNSSGGMTGQWVAR